MVEPSCTKEGHVRISCECGYCSEEVIEKLPHHFVEGKCTCGEVEIIKVSVVNSDSTNTISIEYGSKINPQNYDFLQIDDEFFKAWCNGDEIFSFETLITDEITLTPKYYDKVTVTFVDENGEVLNAKYAEQRAAQYIKQWCVKDYKAEPTFDGSEEVELY